MNITLTIPPIEIRLSLSLDASAMSLLSGIATKQEQMMATLDQILADVTAETTAIGGLSDFIAGLKQQLADALAGTTLPPAVQAQVDQIFAAAEANKQALAAALAANTASGSPASEPVIVTVPPAA